LFCGLIWSPFVGYSQGNSMGENLDRIKKIISVEMQDVSLRDAITRVAEISGVQFVYLDELLDRGKPSTLKMAEKPVTKVLDEIFRGQSVTYVIQTDATIILTKKTFKSGKGTVYGIGTVYGKVIDAASGKILPNANVEVASLGLGAATDSAGNFQIKVPVGTHEMKASVIGFEDEILKAVRVNLNARTQIIFELKQTVILMPMVRVESNRSVLPKHMAVEPTALTVRRSRLLAVPTVGEPDLFRALQTLPGVTAPNDYSNELFIRGGNSDQNLIMLDGAVVYSPYHLMGLAGAFNPDIIEQVNLSLGGFSARYGDRLSSVIDVRTRSLSGSGLSGFGNFSLLSSKLTAFGNVNQKVNWIFSARRSYHDVVANLISKTFPYYFYDFYGKVNVQLDSKNQFFMSGFFSRDRVFSEEEVFRSGLDGFEPLRQSKTRLKDGFESNDTGRINWGNLILTAHWQHEFSKQNTFDLQVSQSSNVSDFGFENEFTPGRLASLETREYVRERNLAAIKFENFETDNNMSDHTVKLDWDLEIANHSLSFGGAFNLLEFDYRWEKLFNGLDQKELVLFFDQAPDVFSYNRTLKQYNFYLEDLWRIGDRLTVRPGVRLENRLFRKEWSIEPRFNVSYQASPMFDLKAAYGRYYQGIATSLEGGYYQSLPLLFAIDGALKPERADHYIVSMNLNVNRWQLSATTYYKKFDGLIRAISSTPDFEQGTGKAYGLEFSARKSGPRLNFEASYVLSYSQKKYQNFEYYNSFDQRHSFSALGTFDLGRNWSVASRWALATGRPFTPEATLFSHHEYDLISGEWTNVGEIENGFADYSEARSKVRYPVYHRLDVSFKKRIQKRGWVMLPYIQILNVYYRKNVFFYDWGENNGAIQRKSITMMPILPTFGLEVEF